MVKPGNFYRFLFRKVKANAELICWLSILIIVAIVPMNGPSLCFFKWAGIDFCPGCGLAHSMQDAILFNFRSSFHHHPLGLVALMVLLYRIYTLTSAQIKLNAKQEFHDPGSRN